MDMKPLVVWALWPAFRWLTRYMLRSGLMLADLGKGDAPAAPDYTPLANSSTESARIMADLGEKQLAQSKDQFEKNMAVAAPIIQAQTDIMQQSKDQGDDYYNYLKGTFRPVEESLVKDATEFSTAGAKENFARQAAADLERQQSNESAQSARAMAAMGVNPNSGRFAAMKRSEDIVNAAARAGAESNARVQADALSTAKKMDAAGLGRNLPGASTGAYSVATNAGNSAVGNQNATSAQLQAGTVAAAGITGTGLQIQSNGLAAIAGAQSRDYNAALSANNSNFGGILSGLGGLGQGLGAMKAAKFAFLA